MVIQVEYDFNLTKLVFGYCCILNLNFLFFFCISQGEVLFDSWNAMFDGRGAEIDPNKIYSFQGKRVYSSAIW